MLIDRPGESGRWFPVSGANRFPLAVPAAIPQAVVDRGAFLPRPLPSQLELPTRTWRLMAEAQEALGRLDDAADRLADRAGLVRLTRHREAQASAGLDGIMVTLQELLLLDLPGVVSARVDDEGAVGYGRADKAAVDLVAAGHPIDLGLLANIASMLTGPSTATDVINRADHVDSSDSAQVREQLLQWPADGVPWREELGWLGGPDPAEAYLVTTPPGAELQASTEQLCAWVDVERDMPLVAKAALGHYQLTVLSPFTGAPHAARLYLTLELVRSGALRDQILPISVALSSQRREYRERLRAMVDSTDVDGWLVFMATLIRDACREQRRRISRLERIRDETLLSVAPRKAAVVQLTESLLTNPILNHNQIADICNVTPGYASKIAERLQDAGLLTKLGDKDTSDYAKVYVCKEILRLFSLYQPLAPRSDVDVLL